MLDYAYFKDNYKLIAVDLSKYLLIQQIVFQGVVGGVNNTKIRLYTILEKSKETLLEFYKGTIKTKPLWIIQMVEYSKLNVKLTDIQLKKLKPLSKIKQEQL